MRYWVNGKTFETEKEAKEYENELKQRDIKKKELEENRVKRWSEVEVAYDTWKKLYDAYMKDFRNNNLTRIAYGANSPYMSILDFWNDIK